MDQETINEMKNVIEHANEGNWLPFSIVCACLFIIVSLFVYILNIKEKANTDHHEKTDIMLEKIVENNTSMNTMIAIHETEIKNMKR